MYSGLNYVTFPDGNRLYSFVYYNNIRKDVRHQYYYKYTNGTIVEQYVDMVYGNFSYNAIDNWK